MSIHLGANPAIAAPARRSLVSAIRELLIGCRFTSLEELGNTLRPRRTRQRLSELARGIRLPDALELRAVVNACRPEAWPRLRQMLAGAVAEHAALARPPSAEGGASETMQPLPLVGEFADWQRLGVHRPITHLASGENLTDRLAAGKLPAYILREKDRLELRPALAAVAEGASQVEFVLVTGQSTAGKTRAAMEAMRAELGSWQLFIPTGPRNLASALDSGVDLRRTVLWFDEIQHLLGQGGGPEQLERLLALPAGPTLVLATLRTDAENALRNMPGWQQLDRRAQRVCFYRRPARADEHERELARARDLDDPWIAEALQRVSNRYGIAEWLAAGPQLLRHHERARTSSDPIHRSAAAIVDAAIDCHRAGYATPIPEALLREAYQLYLDDSADVSGSSVFTAALDWSRLPIAGATGMLVHHRGRGDQAFDYLLGHSADIAPSQSRMWQVLLRQITPNTLVEVAVAALRHGQPSVARELARRQPTALLYLALDDEPGLRRLADTGDPKAQEPLAQMLIARRDTTELLRRANAGDPSARSWLAALVVERNDLDYLAFRADSGDHQAAVLLAHELVEHGNIAELARRADAGDKAANARLNGLRGNDELAARADEDPDAAETLAWRLGARGDIDQLTVRADAGDTYAASELSILLGRAGDMHTLAHRADAGDVHAADNLARLLAVRSDIEQLASRADAGDNQAAKVLASMLADHGQLAGLTSRADAGDSNAAEQLAELLAERGETEELARRAAGGDESARVARAALLAARGELEPPAPRAG